MFLFSEHDSGAAVTRGGGENANDFTGEAKVTDARKGVQGMET